MTRRTAFELRPAGLADEWALAELYRKTVPEPVQRAEAAEAPRRAPRAATTRARRRCPSWRTGSAATALCRVAVCVTTRCKGAIEWARGPGGTWLWLWADTLNPDQALVDSLLRHVLGTAGLNGGTCRSISASGIIRTALNALLSDCGFAPVSDRVKMVKQVIKRIREAVSASTPVVEPASEVVPTTFRTNFRNKLHRAGTDS